MLAGYHILLYHNLFDCGIRILTVGRSIALLIQSLDCYEGASDFVGNDRHIVIVHYLPIIMCVDLFRVQSLSI